MGSKKKRERKKNLNEPLNIARVAKFKSLRYDFRIDTVLWGKLSSQAMTFYYFNLKINQS